MCTVRRRGPGCATTYVGVMTARGNVKHHPIAVRIESRRDDSYVGKMGAAVVGRIERIDIAWPDLAGIGIDDRADRVAHRSEVYRDVRRIGDQVAVRTEQGTGEIQALLDVDRIRCVLQRGAHVFGHRHKQVVEDFEHNRIGAGTDGLDGFTLDVSIQDEVAECIHDTSPAMFNDNCPGCLDDDRRPGDNMAMFHVGTIK